MVITGGASGIGIETARAFASIGADVTLAVRNTAAAKPIVDDLVATTGNDAIRVAPLDLADRTTIDTFAAESAPPSSTCS